MMKRSPHHPSIPRDRGRRPILVCFVIALVLGPALAAAVAADRDRARDYPVQKKEEIRRTLNFADPSKPAEVVVDNFFGPVRIEGYAGRDVLLVAEKTVFAKSEEKAAAAEAEVTLKIGEKEGLIDITVDGPFRDRQEDRLPYHSWRDPGYEVHYAFELRVPFRTILAVSTVTDGDVEIVGVEGPFEVHNVNGKIRMTDIAGEGKAVTVNGALFVRFRNLPTGRCDFKTINGDIVLTLPANAAADFRLKTFNGNAYSDFPVTTLPVRPPIRDNDKGKFIYRANRSFGVRTGKGGPEIALDTMNGNILIKKTTAERLGR
jgi:hypothetical protein